MDLKVVSMDAHQVFGTWHGTVRVAGAIVEVDGGDGLRRGRAQPLVRSPGPAGREAPGVPCHTGRHAARRIGAFQSASPDI